MKEFNDAEALDSPRRPQVVVITGASAGVGRATVREFARHGAHVGLLARGVDGLEQARREVEEAGGRALVLPTDVADAEAVEAAAAAVEAELGPIDVWVNNAMASVFSPVKLMTAAEVKRVTEVTYLGVVYGTLAALKRMLPRDRGVIVQVGSALAYRGIPLQAAYCAAKHAIQGFTESLRCELLHDDSRVRVTMVHLPAMNTPQFDWVKSRMPREPQPVPPIYAPEIAADAIVWAATHRRRELSVGAPTAIRHRSSRRSSQGGPRRGAIRSRQPRAVCDRRLQLSAGAHWRRRPAGCGRRDRDGSRLPAAQCADSVSRRRHEPRGAMLQRR